MAFKNIGQKENLPEKVVRIITESILSEEWAPGDIMPTEPELAGEFGVSRSVIRDAVRMLIARGLVVVRHGKGMYVSQSQNPAFSDAVLLALRRNKATAWDTEQFHALVFPEIFALAAENSTESEKNEILRLAEVYLKHMSYYIHKEEDEESARILSGSFNDMMMKVITASKNKVFILLGQTFLDIRSPRYVECDDDSDEDALLEHITGDIRDLAKSVQSGDPGAARNTFKRVFSFNKEFETILKNTAVTQQPRIKPGHLREE
jgi:GntR family transcriptional regulator, transcriptional repressor for pyruvate dehydrogenase complex